MCCIPIMVTIVSFFLHRTPELLFKKKKIGVIGGKSLIGHRGSRLEGLPENTIAAFKDAAKTAHILELDVWLTKDNHVVVHHDDTLRRMTNGQVAKPVCDLHFHEMPRIVPTGKQTHRLHEYHDDDCHCIPTFEEILKMLPDDMHLIIEFKQDSDILVRKVHDLLSKYNRLDDHKDYWFSLTESINQRLHSYDPNIPRITSIMTMLKILVCFHIGILPYIDIEESVFGIPLGAVSLCDVDSCHTLSYPIALLLYVRSQCTVIPYSN